MDYVYDNSLPPVEVDSILGTATTGASLAGATVRMVFEDTFDETAVWVAGVGTTGQATGDGWSLSLGGDSFSTVWQYTTDGSHGKPWYFQINGGPGGMVFDVTPLGTGTAGSGTGSLFLPTGGGAVMGGTVTYSQPVVLAGQAHQGDLYYTMTVEMFDNGFGSPMVVSGNWSFSQDSDTVVPYTPPPPPPPPPPAPCEVPAAAFPHGGFATIGGFLVPAIVGACPAPEALPVPLGDTSSTAGAGPRDFAETVAVGRPSDRFALTISSVGSEPMSISGVDWTGWVYANKRRI